MRRRTCVGLTTLTRRSRADRAMVCQIQRGVPLESDKRAAPLSLRASVGGASIDRRPRS
jgi:hypothetical protein